MVSSLSRVRLAPIAVRCESYSNPKCAAAAAAPAAVSFWYDFVSIFPPLRWQRKCFCKKIDLSFVQAFFL
jgi:hypothetical protein